MSINLILAINEEGSLGYKNKLLYNIKKDMQHFQQITTYNQNGLKNFVLMGKNTFNSLDKPLENRINVVLTSDKKFSVDDKHVIVAHSLENIINHYLSGTQEKELFIIGGQSIVEQTIDYIQKLYITFIHDSGKKADTYFNLGLLNDFEEIDRETYFSEEYGCEYDFITYVKKEGANEG